MKNDLFDFVIQGFHSNYFNHWTDNHDEQRFGRKNKRIKSTIQKYLNRIIKSYLARSGQYGKIKANINHVAPYFFEYSVFYNLLDDTKSKNILKNLLLFKLLGPAHYKLPLSNDSYFHGIKKTIENSDKNKVIKHEYFHVNLFFHDLSFLRKNIKLYHTHKAIYTDFFLEQYAYSNGEFNIRAQDGDVVIDAGACWGDTPIYFADLVGPKGKVYAFEFIDSNIEIMTQNLKLNPELSNCIDIVKYPLHELSDKEMYFIENGPASQISFEKPKSDNFELIKTLSIDDFVDQKKIERIDMIKMDIEGAEPFALKGASNTLKKFKPKLAIAIYHSESDFVEIAKWLNELNLGYKFYLDHFTIYQEETILFAIADK